MRHFFSFLGQLPTVAILVLLAVVVVVVMLQLIVLTAKIKAVFKVLAVGVVQGLVYLFFTLLFQYSAVLHLAIFVVSFVFSALFWLLLNPKLFGKVDKTDPYWTVIFPVVGAADLVIKNIKRGMVIFGSAGSGKTESGFVPILEHAGKRNMPSLIYDLKNGELTEIAHFFYQNSNIKQSTIIPHEPMYSDRCNPFAPRYLQSEAYLRQQTKLIFANLRKAENVKDSGGSFFDKIPEPTLAAVIWRLKVDYPEFCTLPHAVAYCLVTHPNDIVNFISKNPYSLVCGSPLVDSLISENQVAGVKASLSLPLTDLALPSIFWVMGADEVDLDINNPENPTLLSVVNSPRLDRVNAPFISVIMSTVFNCMQERHRLPSFLLLDEATTFYMDGFSKIPATMRSYDIATVFSTQDMALAKELYGEGITKSILANLSYQMIGKANDPESVKYYKSISEEIEKLTVSKSFSSGLLTGDTRTSEGTRETSKYKNQDFTGLQPGQFFVFADGKDLKYNLGLIKFTRIEKKVKHFVTDKDILDNFNRIMEEVKQLT